MKLRVKSRTPRRQSVKLADALKFRREIGHYSQAEAAEILHVSTRSYWRWERGVVVPRPRHRRQIDAWLSEIA